MIFQSSTIYSPLPFRCLLNLVDRKSQSFRFNLRQLMADLGDDDSSNQTPSRQSPTHRNVNKSPRPSLAREEAPSGGPSSGMVGGGSHGGDDGGGEPSMAAVGDDQNPIGPPPPPPPPADHNPQQGNPMACVMCGRLFSSDRSLSGHMKVHRGRDWRGSYPPPTFSIQEFYDDENAIAHLNPPSPDEGDGNGGGMYPPPRMEEEEDQLNEDENVIPDLNK